MEEDDMAKPTYKNLLEEALEGWQGVRAGVMAEVDNLPEKHFGFRPVEGFRSVRELVDHILESALLMKELLRPDGDFRRAPALELLAEHRGDLPRGGTKKAFLARLETTHRDMDAAFRKAGELHMLQHIRRFDGLPGTRLEWFQHGVAHEYYHCGQLALLARLVGRVPALTQRIHGG
jgi:uncharacterized damage-inducible protein DinB